MDFFSKQSNSSGNLHKRAGVESGVRWIDETHGTKWELVRHFLARMWDGEWTSTPGQWHKVAVSAGAVLLPAGLLLLREGSADQDRYRQLALLASAAPFRAAALADQLALLTLLFAVTGLIAVLEWQPLFPSRRDYLVLAGLPIRPRRIFIARFLTVLLFSAALAAALNLLPSLIAPVEFGGRWQRNPSYLVNAGVQALASGLGCLFVFFAVVALEGVLLNVLPARWFPRVSAYVQGGLIALFSLAALSSWSIQDWPADSLTKLRQFGVWAPPAWFAALHEQLLGATDPLTSALAHRGWAALAYVAVLALAGYALCYRRYRRLLLEVPASIGRRERRRWSLVRILGRSPEQQAILEFFEATLTRSRTHRTIWLGYVGAGIGILANATLIDARFGSGPAHLQTPLRFLELFGPLALTMVFLPGLRHAMRIPAEWPANWLFQTTESLGRKEWMRAVERFVLSYALAPIYLLLIPIGVYVSGWGFALRMGLLQALVSLTIFEILFYSWQQLPFACTYAPANRPLILVLAGYFATLAIAVPVLSIAIRAGAEFNELFAVYLVFFGGIWLWARRLRCEGWGETKFYYEELPGSLPDFGIREVRWEQSAGPACPAPAPRGSSPVSYRRGTWIAGWQQDLRYALRSLRRAPGFTCVALLSLSLGIGVATAAYSELNGFIGRDVPAVRQPAELVALEAPVSYPDYQRFRERAGLFDGLLAYAAPVPFAVALGGHTERLWGQIVSPSYFETLGVHPALGNFFRDEDEQTGRTATVVISYRFWQIHLGGDMGAIDRTLRIDGQPVTIIGIGPKDFQGASPMVYGADLWLPVGAATGLPDLAGDALHQHGRAIFHVVGHVAPGISAERAEAALDTLARQLEREYGDRDRDRAGRRVTLLPGGKLLPVRKQDRALLTGFMTLLGGMILLIACANVINMTLARAADHRREIAVRLALGASRARLVRQLLTESMLVAGSAGILGFLLAAALMRLASHEKLPTPMPLVLNLAPDIRVLAFAITLTVLTGLLFGLAPALAATRPDLTPALKEGGAIRWRRHRRVNVRNLLVFSEVAGSLALLLITGFLVVGHQTIAGLNVGFDASRLAVISLDPVRDGYSAARAADFFHKLLDRTTRLPGIAAASLADSVPMTMMGKPSVTFTSEGRDGRKVVHSGRRFAAGRDFLTTLGIPILRGRGFRQADEAEGANAVVVSEKLVKQCWGDEDPIGRHIEIGAEGVPTFGIVGRGGAGRSPSPGETRVFEVIGVAANVRDGLVMVAADAPPAIYMPLYPGDYARPGLRGVTIVVRATPGMDALGMIRREIASMDDKLTPFGARSMPSQIDELLFPVRVAVWTYGSIGVFGLILAAAGLAGMTAYAVTQRRHEIGVRMALGARHRDVLGLVMKEGAMLIFAGSAAGMVLALAGIRALSALLAEVARTAGTSTQDPLLLAGAPLLLGTLALVACYLPARRSTRIDPAVTLRAE